MLRWQRTIVFGGHISAQVNQFVGKEGATPRLQMVLNIRSCILGTNCCERVKPRCLWSSSFAFTLVTAPVEVTKNGGGWVSVVINTVFSMFYFRPASPKRTSLSNNVS